jgi:hypothetical protein
MDKNQTINLRNRIGRLPALDGGHIDDYNFDDNLTIALATYYENHPKRPSNDEIDSEVGWGKWVIEKTNNVLERVITLLKDSPE